MIVSWRPDPGVTYVDVFSITWETQKKQKQKITVLSPYLV